MASSEKAGALKNAFVNAIADELGGEAMAQAGAMENAKLAGKLGLDVGDQAGMLLDLPSGRVFGINDGNPSYTVKDNNKSLRAQMGPEYGYPVENQGYGATEIQVMPESMQREAAQVLYSPNVRGLKRDVSPGYNRDFSLQQQYDLLN